MGAPAKTAPCAPSVTQPCELEVNEFLSPAEIRRLTQKARRDDQARTLEADGIPLRRRANALIVSCHHALAWLEGRTVVSSREPNTAAIR